MRNVVFETATGRVLMAGCTDFTGGSNFDPAVHTQIENTTHDFGEGVRSDDDGNEVFWYWNGTTFTTTAP